MPFQRIQRFVRRVIRRNDTNANDIPIKQLSAEFTIHYTQEFSSDSDTIDWGSVSQLLASSDYETEEEKEEVIEKIKWKDRTFNKYKPYREMNVRRDTKGKSGR